MKRSAMAMAVAAAVSLFQGCGHDTEVGFVPNPPMAIEPGISVGKVHAGMTLQQIQAELGPPERTTPNALEYTKLGFAVMHGADGLVQVVMCGDVIGNNGPLVKRFNGRTKEDIGLGSTREELLKAYGEPSRDEKFPGARESIRYDQLAMTFSVENGKVHHMIVRFKPKELENRTVEIAP
jgi:hypothetical protein